jgi:hypothetical protein
MNSGSSEGVYFSANDSVRDWVIAFLESFRAYNPDLRLILIPFNDRCERLLKLAPTYRFEVYQDPSFEPLEKIGRRINQGLRPNVPHMFRRFATFWGPLDEFLYLDGRICVLSDLSEILAARRSSGCDLLHYDCALDQVYLPGPWRTQLIRDRRPHGFLAGMFASRKGLFDLDELSGYADRAEALSANLNYPNGDQMFLNFICDLKGVSYGGFGEVMDVSPNGWAWFGGVYRSGQTYRRWDHGGLDHNKRILLMHWAGLRLNAIMPYPGIFLRFRLRPENVLTRLRWRAKWAVQYPFLKVVDVLRRSRWLNVAYHQFRHRFTGGELPQALKVSTRSSAR